jgi:hypothetical protein
MTEEIKVPIEIEQKIINRKSFKERWLEEDSKCEHCGNVINYAKGINRQNMKRLFIGKPSVYDWIFLFIIVATLFMAYEYNIETAQARYISGHIPLVCMQNGYVFSSIGQPINNIPYSYLNFTSNETN